MNYQELYLSKVTPVCEAVKLIKSGDMVVLGGDLCAPRVFGDEIAKIAKNVRDVIVFKDHTTQFEFASNPEMKGHIDSTSFFYGKDLIQGTACGISTFFPSDLNTYTSSIESAWTPNLVAVLTTPMDENGNVYIGLSNMWEGDSIKYGLKCGAKIVAEVNPNLPRVIGATPINIKDIAAVVEVDYPLHQIPVAVASETEKMVAQNVRSLMKDGDCVQFGIGSLPDAIANECMDLKDLGMHTEMATTAMGEMIRRGIITGERKNMSKGKHIFTFAGGDNALYKTLGENKNCIMVPARYGVDPFVIMKNDNMVSVNTIVEMDLTGQVCSESIGTKQISGSGGGFDYAYGAFRSKGGRGILAFTSMTPKGFSKITPVLKEGAAVTIGRNYLDYIVTEYGIAPMRGRTIKQRVNNLIAVAHPDVRAELKAAAEKFNWI